MVGKLITLPYANPENVVNGTVQLVAAGSTQLLASAGAGVRNYITSVIVANGGAADQGIILDGATELGRVWVPTQSSVVIELPVPFRGSLAMALNVNIGGTSNDMRFTAVGYKGA